MKIPNTIAEPFREAAHFVYSICTFLLKESNRDAIEEYRPSIEEAHGILVAAIEDDFYSLSNLSDIEASAVVLYNVSHVLLEVFDEKLDEPDVATMNTLYQSQDAAVALLYFLNSSHLN